MSPSEALEHSATELAWSLWSELGVPGVVRRHPSVVVDPEPLLVVTPILARTDERLLAEVLRWWETHADRLSVSRISGLTRSLPTDARTRFKSFSARRGDDAPRSKSARGVASAVRERVPPRLPVERPSMLRLRMRALCGVGARADTLTSLLLRGSTWTGATELAGYGYSKRTVARILNDLADAGIATRVAEGNSLRFRLTDPGALADLVADAGLPEPRWSDTFHVVAELLTLAGMESKPATVRRVAAHQTREAIVDRSHLLNWRPPPPTRGDPEAWDRVLTWASETLATLAAGTTDDRAATASHR